jgi:hypothetical protein
MDTITTIKVHRQTAKRLKLVAALREETMMHVLEQLVERERARLQAVPKERPDAGHTGV